ncbi:hypothetical protein GE061_011994 [Apolygus lucorum]|uniref:Uncharacterized protein n=1 Tax=Apolygus lucorum TaxID=248454 RepID=A0A6A4JWW1_APOLU|nr:hypothetical protein GE061_011994 [Apolygus lucorum]
MSVKLSLQCPNCKKGFANNAYRMKCDSCRNAFHLECVNFSREDFLFHRDNKKRWLCEPCLKVKRKSMSDSTPTGSQKSSPAPSQQGSDNELEVETPELADIHSEIQGGMVAPDDTVKELLLSFRKEFRENNLAMTRKLDVSTSEIRDLKEHMNTYSDLIQENVDAITALRNEITLLRQLNEDLVAKNTVLEKRVNSLQEKIEDFDQNALAKTVEITGIPAGRDECIVDIVSNVSRAINFDFNQSMIDNCYRRRPASGTDRPGTIAVTFVRRLDKDGFLSSARRKKDLSTRDLGIIDGESVRIFINQSLTFTNRQLLNRAKIFKADNGYRFVWVRNGQVMIRKDENSAPMEARKVLSNIGSKNGSTPGGSGC